MSRSPVGIVAAGAIAEYLKRNPGAVTTQPAEQAQAGEKELRKEQRLLSVVVICRQFSPLSGREKAMNKGFARF